MEAFSDAERDDSKFNRITFCNGFFNLPTFEDAISGGNKLAANKETNLEMWNNRARVLLHEVTHLDYFMNAGDDDSSRSPFVSDLEVNYERSEMLCLLWSI